MQGTGQERREEQRAPEKGKHGGYRPGAGGVQKFDDPRQLTVNVESYLFDLLESWRRRHAVPMPSKPNKRSIRYPELPPGYTARPRSDVVQDALEKYLYDSEISRRAKDAADGVDVYPSYREPKTLTVTIEGDVFDCLEEWRREHHIPMAKEGRSARYPDLPEGRTARPRPAVVAAALEAYLTDDEVSSHLWEEILYEDRLAISAALYGI